MRRANLTERHTKSVTFNIRRGMNYYELYLLHTQRARQIWVILQHRNVDDG